jgi:metallo-beta-lactamase family protein
MLATMEPTLQVLGAADTVTGSRYLLRTEGRALLIDCGLFQGYKALRERNRAPFPVAPSEVDAVMVTHAHLDHSGYLPALVRDGYARGVHVTEGTKELLHLLLPDSGHLLEEEADVFRRHGSRHHEDPRPLYTELDALESLRQLRGHPFRSPFEPVPGVVAEFVPAGHIVGAAQLRLHVEGRTIHFTGDLGRADDTIMQPPAALEPCDLLITESTYGDRAHPAGDPADELAPVIARAIRRGGVVLIPAFAVGRAEAIIVHLVRLRDSGRIPTVPICLNSPMAVEASEIYARHIGELRVPAEEIRHLEGAVHLVRTVEESKALNERGGPMIIVSASGMLTGGRILHHVARFGPDPRNAIILTGYQAGGTRGASLAGGERTLRVFGREIPIGAEVVQLESLSAHADAAGILAWMRPVAAPPALTLVTHGEADAADSLRKRIDRELGWRVQVPSPLDVVPLPEPAVAR